MDDIQPPAEGAAPPPPKLTVLVLSHNRADALRRCLRALEKSQAPDIFRVVVLDCGSRDGSATIDSEFPDVTVQRMARNFGATKALNIGIRTANTDFLLLLDPHIEVLPDTIPGLASLLENSPEAAAVCPFLVDPEGRPALRLYPLPTKTAMAHACRAGDLPERLPAPEGQTPQPVEYPGFKALLVRRQFLKGMNYFDEHYGQAWADAELAFQVWHAQRKILLAPALRAIDHSSADPPVRWTAAQRALLSADAMLGAAHYVRKRYGLLTGIGFRVSLVAHVLLNILIFKDINFNFRRLSALVSGQKIDGTQTVL